MSQSLPALETSCCHNNPHNPTAARLTSAQPGSAQQNSRLKLGACVALGVRWARAGAGGPPGGDAGGRWRSE